MCISEHGDKKYKCCCGCPLICGVIIIFALCLLDLASAITYVDIISIVIYSILSFWFIVSFVRRDCHKTRVSLYSAYAAGFVLFLIYLIWYCFFSDRVQGRAEQICRSEVLDWWDGCADFADDFIWVFVGLYLFIVCMMRLYFVRILYYYAKEIEHHHQQGGDRPYHKLDDHHNPHHTQTAVYYQNEQPAAT